MLCGDPVSRALIDLTEEQLKALAVRLEIEARWEKLARCAPGIRRMAFGNVLRGLLRREWIIPSDDGLYDLHPLIKDRNNALRVI